MNKLETIIYNAVRKNPALKQTLRNTYQKFFDLLPRKKEFMVGKIDFKEGYFFGFHDVSPLSADGTKLLAVKVPFDGRMPRPGECADIGYFDFKDGRILDFHKVDKTTAWNFHKGCRLQWIDNERLIFNTSINGIPSSKIINLTEKESRTFPFGIDAVSTARGKLLATSFSYERLERCMPGYGYPYADHGLLEEAAPEGTGLFIADLSTGERKLELSMKTIAVEVTGKVEPEYLHFVTHTEFSPDGRYVSFLYRRIPRDDDYMKRRSVICTYDIDRKKLHVLPSQESGSHYVWINNDHIIASVNLDGHNCHAKFDAEGKASPEPLFADILNSDGHQTCVDGNVFITDTYPDKHRMAKIFRADPKSGKTELLASLYSPKEFQTNDFKCHIACDLHPRSISGGRYVCFDSPRTGRRSLYVMEI